VNRLNFAVFAGAALCSSHAFADPSVVCTADDPSCTERNVSSQFVSSLVGAPANGPLEGAALDRRTEEVSRQLRCPVCQGSSIGDSPSSTARHMKQQVHDLLGAGFSQDQIFSYFEASYGEFIRLAPKAEGFNALVWILPAVLLFVGGFMAWRYLQGRKAAPATASAAPDAATTDADLDPWLRRIRSMSGDDTSSLGESR
jgi:cytochrome c-type biogenesis protein CcmH